ncbi:hypothetical protein Tco_0945600, partial [Tanacetum coccineum]
NMEMEPDIENITINEYIEYEAAKERQLWDNVRSKRSLTNYDKADFDSFHQNKSNTFIYPYSHNLSPPYPCSLHVQPYPKNYLVSTNFFAQPPHTPNTPVDKKDSGLDETLDDLFRIGAENLMRIGQEKIQNGCDDDTSMDTKHKSGNLLKFPIFPATNNFSSVCEQDVNLEKEEAQVEDDDDGNIYDIWDITIEDVERIRKFLTPNVPDEMDEVMQPLIPQPIHTAPPNDDYVAPATKSILDEILDELLEEFGDEILNVTMVDEEADFNPNKDIEELERLLAKDP